MIDGALADEGRLRQLYVSGAIDLPEFERRLSNAIARDAARASSAARAGAPLTVDERRRVAERIAAARPRRRVVERCPTCRSAIRRVREGGVDTAWCPGCRRYLSPGVAVMDAPRLKRSALI